MKRELINLSRITKTGAVNFIRNFSLSIAAMAVMIVTLTIILFSLVANATFNNTIEQITDKIDISVYLKDNVTTLQRDQMMGDLRQLPNVEKVTYLDKSQVIQSFKSDPENSGLQQAINEAGEALPATIHIKPYDLNKIEGIKQYLSRPSVVALQSHPTSYSGERKEAIDKISHATDTLREIGIIAVLVFAVVSALIIFNTIQMAIFNRRDELRIMRLLGATTWYIRGPFVVESMIYGITSGLISSGLVWAVIFFSSSTLQATSLGLLKISYSKHYFDHNWPWLLLLELGLGILIGAVSSVIATRRYLKFKTSK